MRRILFFDDHGLREDENVTFITRLRRHLAGLEARIIVEKTIHGFESTMIEGKFDVVLLDIMAQPPRNFFSTEKGREGESVHPTLTGIELLRRCREGAYGDFYRSSFVAMRTSRGEPWIMRMAENIGASGYFQAGIDDSQLIQRIRDEIVS